ncbi:MAG: hypothetical protein OK442_06135 [Thaumarchaeota archaeon]|nr:hypothetical protein [Nitrososphaerota archaeon]
MPTMTSGNPTPAAPMTQTVSGSGSPANGSSVSSAVAGGQIKPDSNPSDGYCFYGAGGCSDMTYHNGPVMHGALFVLLFWSPGFVQCTSKTYDPNTNDCAYASIQLNYFQGICGGGDLIALMSQYHDTTGTGVSSCSVYDNDWFYTTGAFPHNPIRDGDLQSVAASMLSSQGISPSVNVEVLVFTPINAPSCDGSNCFDPGGSLGVAYCAYHYYFNDGGTNTLYASMPDAGWAGATCGLGIPSPHNDPYADLEVSPASHESDESMTDPTVNAWYYVNTAHEVGDECAYDFYGQEPDGSNIHVGDSFSLQGGTYQGGPFLVQTEWSNSNGGCVLDLDGATTLWQVSLPGDTEFPNTAQNWYLPIGYVEPGTVQWESNTWPLLTGGATTDLYVLPGAGYNERVLPMCNEVENDGGTSCDPFTVNTGWAFCMNEVCNPQSVSVSTVYGGDTTTSFAVYELFEQQPYMNVVGGGTPPSSSPLYWYAAPASAGADAVSLYSGTLTSTSQDVWAIYSSNLYVYGCLGTGGPPSCSGTNEAWWSVPASTTAPYYYTPEVVNYYNNGGYISNINYNHEYLVTYSTSPTGSGMTSPSGSVWYNPGTVVSIAATKDSGYKFTKWTETTTSGLPITFAKATAASTSATINGGGGVVANFNPTVTATLKPTSGSVAPGSSIKTTLTVKGGPQSVTLSTSALPTGIKVKFATNPITDSAAGVKDKLTISAAASVAPNTYVINIIATGANGKVSTVAYTLIVT